VVYPDETFFLRGFLAAAANLNAEKKLALARRYLLRFFEVHDHHPEGLRKIAEDERPYAVYVDLCKALDAQIRAEDGVRHDGDFLSATILAFGQVFGALNAESKYWVEKSTYNELSADKIFTWWPAARCIQITRDPRDLYASYHRKHPTLTPELFSKRWRYSAETGLKNQHCFGADHYLMIRYEDLVQAPEAQIARLITFLDIRDDDSLRVPTNNGVPWEGNSMFADKFSGISTRPIGRWARELSARDVQIIEQMTGAVMAELGYSPQTKPSVGAYFHMARWHLSQLRYSWRKAREEHLNLV
jgi:hypothetical protein